MDYCPVCGACLCEVCNSLHTRILEDGCLEELQKEVCPMCNCEKVICTYCGEMYCKEHEPHACEL